MMPSTPNWAKGDNATAAEIDASMMSRLAASLFGEDGPAILRHAKEDPEDL